MVSSTTRLRTLLTEAVIALKHTTMKGQLTVYVTKYALTKGVLEVICTFTQAETIKYVQPIKDQHVGSYGILILGKECFLTLEEALAKAEEIRISKLQKLDKEAKRLAKIDFTKTFKPIKQ